MPTIPQRYGTLFRYNHHDTLKDLRTPRQACCCEHGRWARSMRQNHKLALRVWTLRRIGRVAVLVLFVLVLPVLRLATIRCWSWRGCESNSATNAAMILYGFESASPAPASASTLDQHAFELSRVRWRNDRQQWLAHARRCASSITRGAWHGRKWVPVRAAPGCHFRRFTPSQARRCLANRTVITTGNSVSRALHYALAGMLGSADHAAWETWTAATRMQQKHDCPKTGGRLAGQGRSCYGSCVCVTTVGGVRLEFVWQQRIFDQGYSALFALLRNRSRAVDAVRAAAPPLLLANAGLDDILNTWEQPGEWLHRARAQAERFAAEAETFEGHSVWRLSTHTCSSLGGDDHVQHDGSAIARKVAASNDAVAATFFDHGAAGSVPLHEASSQTKLRGKTPMAAGSSAGIVADMFSSTHGACSLFDDGVHHRFITKLHVDMLLNFECYDLQT